MIGFPVDPLFGVVVAGFAALPAAVLIHVPHHDAAAFFALFQLIGCVYRDFTAHIGDMLAAAGYIDVIGNSVAHGVLLGTGQRGIVVVLNGDGNIQTIGLRRLFAQCHGVKLNGRAIGQHNFKAFCVIVGVVYRVRDLFYHIGGDCNGINLHIQYGEGDGNNADVLHMVAYDSMQRGEVNMVDGGRFAAHRHPHMDGVGIPGDGDGDALGGRGAGRISAATAASRSCFDDIFYRNALLLHSVFGDSQCCPVLSGCARSCLRTVIIGNLVYCTGCKAAFYSGSNRSPRIMSILNHQPYAAAIAVSAGTVCRMAGCFDRIAAIQLIHPIMDVEVEVQLVICSDN